MKQTLFPLTNADQRGRLLLVVCEHSRFHWINFDLVARVTELPGGSAQIHFVVGGPLNVFHSFEDVALRFQVAATGKKVAS